VREVFNHGYWHLGAVAKVQVRLHWTLALGLLVFGGLSLAGTAAFVLVLVVHALGQIWAVSAAGGRAETLSVTGIGTIVGWQDTVGASGLVLIAWSGVGAQGLLLIMWVGLRLIGGFGPAPWLTQLDIGLGLVNIALVVVNLLPMPGLEGEAAWFFFRREPQFRPPKKKRKPPPGPLSGEEILRREETERVFAKVLEGLQPPSTIDQPNDED
jgi:hypothetical protein